MQTGQKLDYLYLLQSLMMNNPQGAVALAKMAFKQVSRKLVAGHERKSAKAAWRVKQSLMLPCACSFAHTDSSCSGRQHRVRPVPAAQHDQGSYRIPA
jgi:hypothetical protein